MTKISAINTESSLIRSAFLFVSLVLEVFIDFTSLISKNLFNSLPLLSSISSLSYPVALLESVDTEKVRSFTLSDQQIVSSLLKAF